MNLSSNMRFYYLIFIFFFQFKNIIISQPDSRFGAFDWTLIKDSGSINSITEGYNNIYIGEFFLGLCPTLLAITILYKDK